MRPPLPEPCPYCQRNPCRCPPPSEPPDARVRAAGATGPAAGVTPASAGPDPGPEWATWWHALAANA